MDGIDPRTGTPHLVNDDTQKPARSAAPPGDAASDEALLAAVAARRDRVAFAQLFERYAGRIKGFLIRAGATEGLAEEATQEVMVSLWRFAGRYDPNKASAATWIFTIARNKRIDLLRRNRRDAPDLEDMLLAVDAAPSAEEDHSALERDRQVRAALAELPETQREIVRMAFFSGLSHGEIAASLGLPLGTVKSRLRLAFGRLRSALGDRFVHELEND
ncbi:MAG: sigma-70 family RNA polymerase sigma factor [Paracoccaceae bacterium]